MDKIKRLGILTGADSLPLMIIDECRRHNVPVFCVLIGNFANPDDYKDVEHINAGFGEVNKILDFFHKNKVTHVVFAGAVKKPSFSAIKTDGKGVSLLKSLLKNKLFGDNSVLDTVVKFMEKEGFKVVKVNELLPDLTLRRGYVGSVRLEDDFMKDIEFGRSVLDTLSRFDIGQSIAIQQGYTLGIECLEGTEKLIGRAGSLRYADGRRPILVKMKKIDQTAKADLPSIGPDTIEQLVVAGFAGIALEAKNCLILQRPKVIEMADKNGIAILAI